MVQIVNMFFFWWMVNINRFLQYGNVWSEKNMKTKCIQCVNHLRATAFQTMFDLNLVFWEDDLQDCRIFSGILGCFSVENVGFPSEWLVLPGPARTPAAIVAKARPNASRWGEADMEKPWEKHGKTMDKYRHLVDLQGDQQNFLAIRS